MDELSEDEIRDLLEQDEDGDVLVGWDEGEYDSGGRRRQSGASAMQTQAHQQGQPTRMCVVCSRLSDS
ncbi:hypothetical protein [Streptomyces sp. enrichment culture]|uniref:hypothetical protein n=1 Tax=Streptomyces sp. enrichment culture TaxID=1795815 RepID=UPI003F55FA7B